MKPTPPPSIIRLNDCGTPAKNSVHATTANSFFKDEFIIKVIGDKVTFKRCGIDFVGKSRTATAKTKNLFAFSIPIDACPGEYEFDEEESDEDVLVLYLNNN